MTEDETYFEREYFELKKLNAELLAALKVALPWVDDELDIMVINRAIAKAEGK